MLNVMMYDMPIELNLVLSAASVAFCYRLAETKGRSMWWVLAGFVLGIPVVLILVAAPDLKREEEFVATNSQRNRDLREKLYRLSVEFDEDRPDPVCVTCAQYDENTATCLEFGLKPKRSTATCKFLKDKKYT